MTNPPAISAYAAAILLLMTLPRAQSAVTIQDMGSSLQVGNGEISATITKASARIPSLRYHGQEMTTDGIYFSMDGGADYSNPGACAYSAANATPDMADLSFACKWTHNRAQAFDISIHYVFMRGEPGLYTYAVLEHPAAYPATSVGEWRIVWKISDDLLERIYVDSLRNNIMPSSADMAKAQSTFIKEIVLLTSGPRAGTYESKYNYNAEYYALGTYGHASDIRKIGAWMVMGGNDYLNDGPTKRDLTAHYGLMLHHWNRNHYNSSSIRVGANQAWRKIYGPLLLYFNTNPGGADACWEDAKARARQEEAAWPYAWLTGNPDYPPEASRGNAQGTLALRDKENPARLAANAWVGLAQPPPGGNWQFDAMHYQYWTRADAQGRFDIRHVRPGDYTLYGFADGETGEYAQAGIRIQAGQTLALGDVEWKPNRAGKLLWEIGIPNRYADEFRHGRDYFHPFLWQSFSKEFANPLEYRIGASDWRKDWNYAHTSYDSADTKRPWKWRIHFSLDPPLPSGDGRLQLAIAGANKSSVQVFLNDESRPLAEAQMKYNYGNILWRQTIHDKYFIDTVNIPAARFRLGDNVMTLVATGTTDSGSVVIYDYLRLEAPDGNLSIGLREAIGARGFRMDISAPGREGLNINYILPAASGIRFRLTSLDGRCLRTLELGWQTAGAHTADRIFSGVGHGSFVLEGRAGGEQVQRRINIP